MPNKFREMGSYLIQIGLYFTTKDTADFEESELHNNITNYLIQSYLYLLNYNKELEVTTGEAKTDEIINETTLEEYLTKKEVIQIYYPYFTEYGLTQAIHKNTIPYHKRGAKYFFKKSEIDEWITNNGGKQGKPANNRHQYV